MKVANVEGVANYNGLESCGATRKDDVEALTEERAGWVLSRENMTLPSSRPLEGEVAEVLNRELCGARHVLAALRWLKAWEKFTTEASNEYQLIYLMEGKGSILLNNKNYDVAKGAGIYLGPSEIATIEPAAGVSLKLLQLVVGSRSDRRKSVVRNVTSGIGAVYVHHGFLRTSCIGLCSPRGWAIPSSKSNFTPVTY